MDLFIFIIYSKVGLLLVNALHNYYTIAIHYNFMLRSLSEFTITETELKLIANAAIIGDNKMPKKGYKTPAAIGMPSTL